MGNNTSQGMYRQQICRLVRAISLANHENDIADELSNDSRPSSIKMFVDGNLQKRFDRLERQLEFVAETFEGFAQLIVEYMGLCPLAEYDNGISDTDRMLVWLTQTRSLSAKQKDYVACQRACHTIEQLGRQNRPKHIRFQKLLSISDQSHEDLSINRRLRIYLNPIRTWGQFETAALLDEYAHPPTNVLFFAAGDEVCTAILELEGQVLINELADFGPCTLDEWAALTTQADWDYLHAVAGDLADMGLVAFSDSQ